jgi:GR25 family glycosyltransferase involved in LPS biosynthesis
VFTGLYINLDRKPERRARMEAEFRRFRLTSNYQRISAVDGQSLVTSSRLIPGAVGCFRSHLKTLEIASRAGSPVHILEDDKLLSDRLKPFLSSAECLKLLAQFDLLFLENWVDVPSLPHYRRALSRAGTGYEALDLRDHRIGTTSSYVISPRSAARLAVAAGAEAAAGPRIPIDSFYSRRMKAGALKAAVVVPFLTCMDIESGAQSSIQTMSQSGMVKQAKIRTSFFVDPGRQPSYFSGGVPRTAPAAARRG